MNKEQPSAKQFEWKVENVDRVLGHVFILHNATEFKWHLTEDGRVILTNQSDELLTPEEHRAMELQVKAILKPELEKRQE